LSADNVNNGKKMALIYNGLFLKGVKKADFGTKS